MSEEGPAERVAGSRSIVAPAIRLVVSIVLLAALLYMLPLQQVGAAMLQLRPALWVGALGVFLLGHVVAALKWRLLMPATSAVPVAAAVRAHFGGLAANLFLPGLVGGDLVRAAWLGHSVGRWEGVAVAGVVDRVLDTAALLILAAVGVLGAAEMSPVFARLLLAGVVLVALAVVAMWIAAVRLRAAPAGSRAAKIATAIGALQERPSRAVLALGLSIAVQTTFIAITARFGAAVGLVVGIEPWLAAWPLAKIAAIIPVTFAGIGTREAALVALMRMMGADPSLVAAAAFLWTSVLICGALVGGLIAWVAGSPRSA